YLEFNCARTFTRIAGLFSSEKAVLDRPELDNNRQRPLLRRKHDFLYRQHHRLFSLLPHHLALNHVSSSFSPSISQLLSDCFNSNALARLTDHWHLSPISLTSCIMFRNLPNHSSCSFNWPPRFNVSTYLTV